MSGTQNANVSNPQAGSPSGEPAYLVVGKLRHTHGLHGEMLMEVITDFPERLKEGVTVLVGPAYRPLRIRSRRSHGQGLLLSFDGFDAPEAMHELRNQLVFVPTANRPTLPEGEYYHHQLLGLSVVSDEDQNLGRLAEILNTNANDVYVVRNESGAELLLPAIPSVVLSVDLAAGEMRVHLLAGLTG